ncbi:MAG: ribose-phosphate diphosphokinase [Sphingomonas sp.]|nr:ribose-phosphate diphosphokinase [Sphingomonas sp.]
MTPLLFALDGESQLAVRLLGEGFDAGALERRQFPDGESYVRLLTSPKDRDVVLLSPLDRPDAKTLPLLFAADAARALGARSVGLAAPYLAYMRQDQAFHPGEAVTSRTYAGLLSARFDWLATLDPHLHRYKSLDAIYSIPAVAGSATRPVAEWIEKHVERPFLIGPDVESEQWVEAIAALANAPFSVFHKVRRGDRDVRIEGTRAPIPPDATPVIVDDIASSSRTMIEAVRLLKDQGMPPPVCIAVHPLFAGDAFPRLLEAGPAAVISTNSVAHPSNAIDVSTVLAETIRQAREAFEGNGMKRSKP